MPMPRYWAILLVSLVGAWGDLKAQEAQLLFNVQETILDLEADHLGHLYVLHRDRLIKTDRSGQELARFSRPDLGIPDRINVYDPMRILLFYRNFNLLLVLDNQLNLITAPISLFDWGLVDVPCAALADENYLWLYDQVSDRLLKVDLRDGRSVFRSPPLTQLVGRENQPLRLRTNVRGLFVLLEEGVAVFDAMGNFSAFVPQTSPTDDLHLRAQGYLLSAAGVIQTAEGKEVQRLPPNAHWTDDGERLYWTEGRKIWWRSF